MTHELDVTDEMRVAERTAAKPEGPPRVAGARAVRPRHAATLILVRTDHHEPQILMGRRAGGHVFMPDKWVFPGGRVDRGDYTAPAAAELRPEVAARLNEGLHARHAGLPRALALAAVRETFEEAGLLLAKSAPARPAVGHWRDFLAHGGAPDLSALDFVARAITPPAVGRRFDARFFMANASRLLTLDRAADTGELDEIAWFTLAEAARLDLPTITRFVVREAGERLAHPAAVRPVPFIRWSKGGRAVSGL